LANQSREKKNKILHSKEADRHFVKTETNKLEIDESNRNKFFAKLKNIQVKNDEKQKSLLKYMKQDKSTFNAKKDEQTYIKNIELDEKKAIRKDFSDKQNRDKNIQQNYEMLNQQLQEKKFVKQVEKEQQLILKKQFDDEVNKVSQEKINERNKQKERQLLYNNQLNSQLKEKTKKNQYSVLMSEHERWVNDRDIKAYQNMDTKALNAQLPGFNSQNPQDKYIDKNMNGNGKNTIEPQTVKAISSKINDCLWPLKDKTLNISINSKGRNINNKLKDAGLRSFELFGDNKGIDIPNQNLSSNKLERVRQNMEKEDAMKFRANTNNRGYGFEQVLEKNNKGVQLLSSKSAANIEQASNPYEYNFRVGSKY